MTQELPEALKPFDFHGFELSLSGSQAKTECPHCGEHKCYVAKDTGKYHCKVCDASGNSYTFMTQHHAVCLKNNSETDFKRINKLRDNAFTTDQLKNLGVCMNGNGDVLLPQKMPGKKNLSNLRRWNPSNKIAYNTPGCCTPFFVQWSKTGPVYLLEGEWDGLSLQRMMQRAKHQEDCSIVTLPGVNVLRPAWVKKWFYNRDVVILFDKDPDKEKPDGGTFNPAKQGTESAIKKLSGSAASIKVLNWDKITDKDEFDVRDYWLEAKAAKKSKRYLKKLLEACEPAAAVSKKKSGVVKTLERDTFDAVVEDFRNTYHINQSFIDCLACCFASIISLRIQGNPLWLFIVAPPSSGKTTLIEAFEAADGWTQHLSKLTATALVSGWGSRNQEEDEDPSMLGRLRDKVLFVKDFTAVLSMGTNDKEKLFGVLRDAYDGRFIQHYGNGLTRFYEDLYFGIVAGVTHSIHGENRSSLGERFLKVNLLDEEFVEVDHIERALGNVKENKDHKLILQGSVNGFLEHLAKIEKIPALDPEKPIFKKLIALAQLVAFVRTTVERHSGRDMSYRPSPEIGTRIATQLNKLGIGLAMVLGHDEITDECYRIMQKVAFDSCVGWQLEVLQHLDRSESGLSAQQISESMNISISQIRKVCDDMQQINLVEIRRVSNGTGNRGNKVKKYFISDHIRQLMDQAHISFKDKPKSKTPSKRAKRSRKRRTK